MEPLKTLSLLLQSPMQTMIHKTLDYFLRFQYEVFEMPPKIHIGAYAMFNTFMDTFREKILILLEDVEQFFLWVVAGYVG